MNPPEYDQKVAKYMAPRIAVLAAIWLLVNTLDILVIHQAWLAIPVLLGSSAIVGALTYKSFIVIERRIKDIVPAN
jgi:hypothetical protein